MGGGVVTVMTHPNCKTPLMHDGACCDTDETPLRMKKMKTTILMNFLTTSAMPSKVCLEPGVMQSSIAFLPHPASCLAGVFPWSSRNSHPQWLERDSRRWHYWPRAPIPSPLFLQETMMLNNILKKRKSMIGMISSWINNHLINLVFLFPVSF